MKTLVVGGLMALAQASSSDKVICDPVGATWCASIGSSGALNVTGATASGGSFAFSVTPSALPAPDFPRLAPSAAWTGALNSVPAPAAAIQTLSSTKSDTSAANCGGRAGCVEITVGGWASSLASTAAFGPPGATPIVCAKYVNGTAEANGCWKATVVDGANIDLQGSTYANPLVANPAAYIAVANGAQAVSGAARSTAAGLTGKIELAVGSTAHLATGDQYTVSGVLGAVEANGTWPVTVIDATHLVLGTTKWPGPNFANAYAGGGVLAFAEPVIAGLDEHSGVVISTQNTELVTVGAAVGNRQGVDHVTCYYEGASATQTTQAINPRTDDDGYVFGLNWPTSGTTAGDAQLTCDAVPVNGFVRRLAIRTWLNSAGDSSRPVVYVDPTWPDAVTPPSTAGCGSGFGTLAKPYGTMLRAINCAPDGAVVYVGVGATGSVGGQASGAVGGGPPVTPLTFNEAAATNCKGGGSRCTANLHQIDIRPCYYNTATAACSDLPIPITAIASWSGGTVTLTVPNAFSAGQQVLVTGMVPLEYNGLFTLSGATKTSISYPCCNLPGEVGENNPLVVHPDQPLRTGQAAVPYIITSNGQLNFSAQNFMFVGAVVDASTASTLRSCIVDCALNTPVQPYVNYMGFNNSAYAYANPNWGPAGPPYGLYAGSGAQSLVNPLVATPNFTNFYGFEESFFEASTLVGASHHRNVLGYAPWSLFILSWQNLAFDSFNINVAMPIAGNTGIPSNIFANPATLVGQPQRMLRDPWDGVTTTACGTVYPGGAGMTAGGYFNCMPSVVADPVYDRGSNTTPVTVYASGNTGFVANVTLKFLSGGCEAYTSSQHSNINSGEWPGKLVNGPPPTATVNLTGDWTDGGLCGATGIHAGDSVYVYTFAHGNIPKFVGNGIGAGGSAGNSYIQRMWSMSATTQPPFFQPGAFGGDAGATITTSGTAATIANAAGLKTVPFAGSWIHITGAGSNQNQYRQVTGIPGTGNPATNGGRLTLSRAFSPDIATGVSWNLGNNALGMAIVGSAIGGNSAIPATPDSGQGNATGAGQYQHGMENIVWLEDTLGYAAFSLRWTNTSVGSQGQGGGFGSTYFWIADNAQNAGCPSFRYCGSPYNATTVNIDGNSWGNIDASGAMVPDGMAFDNNAYGNDSATPGVPDLNGTAGPFNVADFSYRPCSAASAAAVGCALDGNHGSPMPPYLTKTMRGAEGGNVANGTPLFPFTMDGAPITGRAIVGAMQP